MAEDFGEIGTADEVYIEEVEKKRNNTVWIIVAIVAVVLLCCCALIVILGVWMWNTGGDLLLENLDWSMQSLFKLI